MILITFCISSCKEVIINDVIKKKYVAGIPSQSNSISYEFNVEVNTTFSLKEIALITDGKKTIIKRYSFINTEAQSGYIVTEKQKLFEQGFYKFSFIVASDKDYLTEEFLNITYLINEKEHFLKNLPIKNGGILNQK